MDNALPLIAYPDLANRVKALEDDGYVYLPGILNADEVRDLRAVMDRLAPLPESFDKHSTPESGGFLNKHVNNAFNRDPHFLQFVDRPEVIEIAEAAHGDDCHIIGMTSWITGPGRPDQGLHADWQPLELPEDVMTNPAVKIPIYITTAHYYLDDLYVELGPTQFYSREPSRGARTQRRYGIQWRWPQIYHVQCRRRGHLPQRGVAPRHGQYK